MRYIPSQGDIITMDFDPQMGHEQGGRRPALVVSNAKYNRFCKMAVVCPITNVDKEHAFHVKLGDGYHTKGVVLCDQFRAMDIIARNATLRESVSSDILDEVIDIICSFME